MIFVVDVSLILLDLFFSIEKKNQSAQEDDEAQLRKELIKLLNVGSFSDTDKVK